MKRARASIIAVSLAIGCGGPSGGAPVPGSSGDASASATAAAATGSGVSTLPSASPAVVNPPGRVRKELGDFAASIIANPDSVEVAQLAASGWVDPSTRDMSKDRIGGFTIAKPWGAPKNADFGKRLGEILLDDASMDFDIATRCAPSKGVIGIALEHRPVCGPKASCSLDVSNVVINFPCHQIFVTTRELTNGKWQGKVWAAHFGPSKSRLLGLLTEGFPDHAAAIKALE